jgi:cytochrome c-type biogenesis protein CcmH
MRSLTPLTVPLLLSLLMTACGGSGPQTGISGTVSLDPQLADQVSAEETVFLFARRPAGPPMPLAIQRLTVGDLPYRFTLDDSQAMTDLALSSVEQAVVVARVSRSGQAMPQSGDLEGESGPVSTTGTDNLEIVIDRVRP